MHQNALTYDSSDNRLCMYHEVKPVSNPDEQLHLTAAVRIIPELS